MSHRHRRVHALTLPGMESKDTDRSGITLQDQLDEIVRAVDEAGDPVLLADERRYDVPATRMFDPRPGWV